MAVPATAYTLDQLALKVAEKLAVANYATTGGTPYLPTDEAFNLHKCCELVTRGINLFVDSAPKEGWQWMQRIASVTFDPDGTGSDNINSDASRYKLPVDFGGEAAGKIRYTASTAHGTPIEWVHQSYIRDMRSIYVTTSYPMYAAILPHEPTTNEPGSSRRWELLVHPKPSTANTVEFPYILNFDGCRLFGGTADSASATTIVDATFATTHPADDALNGWYVEVLDGTGRGSYAVVTDYAGSTGTFTVADWLKPDGTAGGTDPGASSEFIVKPAHPYYHPAGVTFDSVVEAACLAACEIYETDKIFDDHFTGLFYKRKLPEAYLKNRRMKPRRLGRMTNGARRATRRVWADVTTPHDIP